MGFPYTSVPILMRPDEGDDHVGGVLVVAAHLGRGEVQVTELLGHQLSAFGGTLFGAEEITNAVTTRGFVVEDVQERDPLPHEHPSRRIYLIARTS